MVDITERTKLPPVVKIGDGSKVVVTVSGKSTFKGSMNTVIKRLD